MSKVSYVFKGLKEVPEAAIKPHMKGLILDWNYITELPPSVSQWTSLEQLSVANNHLTSLPDELAQVTTLQNIHLEHNQIQSLPDHIIGSMGNLRELYLTWNPLGSLPPSFQNLTNLHSLAITGCKLGEFFEKNPSFYLPDSIQFLIAAENQLTSLTFIRDSMKYLTTVDLAENQLTEIPATFLKFENLKNLYISCNKIKSLPSGFEVAWPHLLALDIEHNEFTSLPDELASLPSLKKLEIAGNPLPPIKTKPGSIADLLKLLKGENTTGNSFFTGDLKIGYKGAVPDLVMPNLYLGCYECAKHKVKLEELGVTHILTIADYIPLYPKHFTYKVVDIVDEEKTDIYVHFEDCIRYIDDAIKSGGKVLVHCRAGVSRSATIVTAYMMQLHKLPSTVALIQVKEKRKKVHPNFGFVRQLTKWEVTLGISQLPTENSTKILLGP